MDESRGNGGFARAFSYIADTYIVLFLSLVGLALCAGFIIDPIGYSVLFIFILFGLALWFRGELSPVGLFKYLGGLFSACLVLYTVSWMHFQYMDSKAANLVSRCGNLALSEARASSGALLSSLSRMKIPREPSFFKMKSIIIAIFPQLFLIDDDIHTPVREQFIHILRTQKVWNDLFLSSADFSESNLSDMHLNGVRFRDCNFSATLISQSDFSNTRFEFSYFNRRPAFDLIDGKGGTNSHLAHSNFSGAVFETTRLENVAIWDTDFSCSTFSSTLLRNNESHNPRQSRGLGL